MATKLNNVLSRCLTSHYTGECHGCFWQIKVFRLGIPRDLYVRRNVKYDLLRIYRSNELEVAWDIARYFKLRGIEEEQMGEFLEIVASKIRSNVDRAINILNDNGYIFCCNFDGLQPRPLSDVWRKPKESTEEILKKYENEYGRMGFLVETWISKVGDVNLNGFHPSWGGLLEADPMWIEFEGDSTEGLFEHIVYENEEPYIMADYQVEFAPDSLHKANISGGGGPLVNIPPMRQEGSVQIGLKDIGFRDYLNTYFINGCFGDISKLIYGSKINLEFIHKIKRECVRI